MFERRNQIREPETGGPPPLRLCFLLPNSRTVSLRESPELWISIFLLLFPYDGLAENLYAFTKIQRVSSCHGWGIRPDHTGHQGREGTTRSIHPIRLLRHCSDHILHRLGCSSSSCECSVACISDILKHCQSTHVSRTDNQWKLWSRFVLCEVLGLCSSCSVLQTSAKERHYEQIGDDHAGWTIQQIWTWLWITSSRRVLTGCTRTKAQSNYSTFTACW